MTWPPEHQLAEWRDAPPDWLDNFTRNCGAYGLRLYREQLEELVSGTLPRNDLYTSFQERWERFGHGPGRSRQALLMGGTGAGKSLCAMWAAMRTNYYRRTWTHIEPAQLAEAWARRDWGWFRELEQRDLVIFDELADSPDLRGPAWAQLKYHINRRYRDRRDSILIAIPSEAVVRAEVLGDEIVDRVPPSLRIDAGKGSWRHGGGV